MAKKTLHCLNCGKRIGNVNFCPHCGQQNTDRKISVGQMLHEFLGDYFTFDSKFFRSLLPLMIKPGHLTKEYVSGRRVSYILPVRLYVFTTLIFFFVLALNTKLDEKNLGGTPAAGISPSDSLKSTLTRYRDIIPEEVQDAIVLDIDTSFVLTPKDSKGPKFTFGGNDPGNSRIRKYLHQKGKYLSSLGKQGTVLFVKEIINQIPKVFFILLPVFALILKLIYIRHRIFFIEHLIFTLHYHTFIFLLLIVPVLLPKWYVILSVILMIFVYLFLSMRKFYEQSFLKTFLKMQLALFLYSFSLVPALIILLLLAVVSV